MSNPQLKLTGLNEDGTGKWEQVQSDVYVLLTPYHFHDTEQNLMSLECPDCAAVVTTTGWERHAQFHDDLKREIVARHIAPIPQI